MATVDIVPRANDEGGIGDAAKRWNAGYFTNLNVYSAVFTSNSTTTNMIRSTSNSVFTGTTSNSLIYHRFSGPTASGTMMYLSHAGTGMVFDALTKITTTTGMRVIADAITTGTGVHFDGNAGTTMDAGGILLHVESAGGLSKGSALKVTHSSVGTDATGAIGYFASSLVDVKIGDGANAGYAGVNITSTSLGTFALKVYHNTAAFTGTTTSALFYLALDHATNTTGTLAYLQHDGTGIPLHLKLSNTGNGASAISIDHDGTGPIIGADAALLTSATACGINAPALTDGIGYSLVANATTTGWLFRGATSSTSFDGAIYYGSSTGNSANADGAIFQASITGSSSDVKGLLINNAGSEIGIDLVTTGGGAQRALVITSSSTNVSGIIQLTSATLANGIGIAINANGLTSGEGVKVLTTSTSFTGELFYGSSAGTGGGVTGDIYYGLATGSTSVANGMVLDMGSLGIGIDLNLTNADSTVYALDIASVGASSNGIKLYNNVAFTGTTTTALIYATLDNSSATGTLAYFKNDGNGAVLDVVSVGDNSGSSSIYAINVQSNDTSGACISLNKTGVNLIAPTSTGIFNSPVSYEVILSFTTTFGDILYWNGSNWAIADASAIGTTKGLMQCGVGGSGSHIERLVPVGCGAMFYKTSWSGATATNGWVYLTITGTTGNTLSTTAPSGSGEQVIIVGYKKGTTLFVSQTISIMEMP